MQTSVFNSLALDDLTSSLFLSFLHVSLNWLETDLDDSSCTWASLASHEEL